MSLSRYRIKYKDADNKFYCYKNNDTGLAQYQIKWNDTSNNFEIQHDGRDCPARYYDGDFQAGIGVGIFKVSTDGKELWTHHMFTSHQAYAVAIDAADCLYQAGNLRTWLAYAAKVDVSSPTKAIWTFDHDDTLNAIAVDTNSDVVVGGDRLDGKSVWKLNSAGVEQWSFDTGGIVQGITTDSADNVIVVGDFNAGTNKSVWKLNSAGVEQWSYSLNGNHAYCVSVNGTDDIFIGGLTSGAGDEIEKLNSAGALQWGYNTGRTVYGIAVSPGGKISAGGIENAGNKNVWRLTAAGALDWDFLTGTNYVVYGIAVDGDNTYAANVGNIAPDIFNAPILYKIDTLGAELWSYSPSAMSGAYQVGRGACVDSGGNIYVAGSLNYDN